MNQTLNSHMAEGISLAKEGKWLESIGYFKLVLDEEANNTDAWFNVAKACYELKDYPYVIYCLTKLQELEGKDPSTLDLIGDSYFYLEQYDQAVKIYREALELSGNEIFQSKIDESQKIIAQNQGIIAEAQQNAGKWAEDYYRVSILVNKTPYNFVGIFRDHLYLEQVFNKLIESGKDISSIKILDLGCGEGKILRSFINWKAQPENLFGIDVSPFIIDHAKTLSSPKINFAVGTLDQMPFENEQFDVILSRGVLQHITDKPTMNKVAYEIQRLLKPDGTMIFFEASRMVFGNQFFTETTVNRNEEDYRTLFPAYQIVCQPALLNEAYLQSNSYDIPRMYKEASMPGNPQHTYQFVYMNL